MRYLNADWAREQQIEPACHTAMRYIALGRPSALPDDFFSCFPSHQRPTFSEILELAGKGPPTTAPSCSSVNRPHN